MNHWCCLCRLGDGVEAEGKCDVPHGYTGCVATYVLRSESEKLSKHVRLVHVYAYPGVGTEHPGRRILEG